MTDEGKVLACFDGATALRCAKMRFEAIPCHGALGCSGKYESPIFCDASLADEGEACVSDNSYSAENS